MMTCRFFSIFLAVLFLTFIQYVSFVAPAFAKPSNSAPPDSSKPASASPAKSSILMLESSSSSPFVAEIDLNMMILPGTAMYLSRAIESAHVEGAKALIVHLNTPGGLLTSSQEMTQAIFASPLPVIIYVSPGGSTATSAGVFITLSGHVAAMAPGTSIGAAHPVSGDGKDIEGDMRQKAENMTVAMVKSISEQRGRNVAWAEKAVKESSSATESEALKMGVIDLVAEDVSDLLRQAKGKEVKLNHTVHVLEDYSKLPRRTIGFNFKERAVNVLANPNVAALLWLAATTGLSIELYNPGAILPGVVGVICLILALAVSQVIPVNSGAVLLMAVGAGLIGLELFVPSGILGIGGLIAMVLGAMYLIDAGGDPGLVVSLEYIIPAAVFFGGIMLFISYRAFRSLRRRPTTGLEGLIGLSGTALGTVTQSGKVSVNGEVWSATSRTGIIESNSPIKVVGVREGLLLEVCKSE